MDDLRLVFQDGNTLRFKAILQSIGFNVNLKSIKSTRIFRYYFHVVLAGMILL